MKILRNSIYGVWKYFWEDPINYHIVKERIYFLPFGLFIIRRKEIIEGQTWKTSEQGSFEYDACAKTLKLSHPLNEEWQDVTLHDPLLTFKDKNGEKWTYHRTL